LVRPSAPSNLKFSFRRFFDSHNKSNPSRLRKDGKVLRRLQNLGINAGMNCSSGISLSIVTLRVQRRVRHPLFSGDDKIATVMDRRERRRRARERKKLEERLTKETSEPSTTQKAVIRPRPILNALGRAKVLGTLFMTGLALLGGYAILRPHVSVEPYISLNPVNPYLAQFTVKNESALFDVTSLDCVCWPRTMSSRNGFSIVSPGPLQNMHQMIPVLKPGLSSTVDCPQVIGGIGSHSGKVDYAELEIVTSYKQSGWPFTQAERHPFAAMTDSQGAVRWVPITPERERSLIPK
jgi:hypothetical protein